MTASEITDSAGLLALVKDAEGTNRSADLSTLSAQLDSDGIHVLERRSWHHGRWRTWWLVKVQHTAEPLRLCLDVSPRALEQSQRRIKPCV